MRRKELLVSAVGGIAAASIITAAHLALAAESQPVNPAPHAPPAAAAPASFADIVARVAPAVVSIDVEGRAATPAAFGQNPQDDPFQGFEGGPFGDLRRFFPQLPDQVAPQPFKASGSGFFISDDGYIVTNNHVVAEARKVTVRTSDDRTLPARVVGRDPATDLAVIKVDGGHFPFVDFEDRAKPRVGDWVVALGNPFNLGGTATAGIVSALSRPNVSGSSYVDYLQIDAPINRGNSGGPTFDLYGRVVGVNTAIFSPSGGSVGIGFDIPADVAARVAHQLIANGKVVRGYIGATVQNITPEIADSLGVPAHHGALVADVAADGPGERAGLRSGDIVERIDGAPVNSAADLTRQVGLKPPGAQIRLDVRRDGRMQTLTLASGVRPAEEQLALNDAPGDGGGAGQASLGLTVTPNPGGGLRVDGVRPGSDAAQKGVRPGDVIQQVAGRPAATAEDVRVAIDAARRRGHSEVLVRIARQGQHIFLPLKVAASG